MSERGNRSREEGRGAFGERRKQSNNSKKKFRRCKNFVWLAGRDEQRGREREESGENVWT